jgi:hypothetical protein
VTGDIAYRLLGLPKPSAGPAVRAPEPVRRGDDARVSHLVLVGADPEGRADLVVRRFAPGLEPDLLAGYEADEVCRHSAVGEDELDLTVRDNAEVLLLGRAPGFGGADGFSQLGAVFGSVLAREAGCLRVVCTVTGPGRCLVAARGLDVVVGLAADAAYVDPAVLPSVFLAVASQEHDMFPAALKRLRTGVRVRVGASVVTVSAYDPASVQPSRSR